MNKAQFIELIQKNGGYKTKAEAENAVSAFVSSVTEAVAAKEDVSLVGFGTFKNVETPAKSGKVPGTDKTYSKPASRTAKFKAGKALADAAASAK